MKRKLIALIVLSLLLAACSLTPTQRQQQQADLQQQIEGREVFIPQNDMELDNYNRRQEISDDPTTILWCTFFPPTMGQEPFTMPIVGKLTSGGKRPFPTTIVKPDYTYNPELPQPDGMYGTSGEYRYGFTPAGMYVDFTDLSSFCTTEPTIWQRNQTNIILEVDTAWAAVQKQARAALEAGDTEKAMEILSAGIQEESND